MDHVLLKLTPQQLYYLRVLADEQPHKQSRQVIDTIDMQLAEQVAQHKVREAAKAQALEAVKNAVPKRAASAVLADLKRNGATDVAPSAPPE